MPKRTQNEPKRTHFFGTFGVKFVPFWVLLGLFWPSVGRLFPAGWSFLTNLGLILLRWRSPAPVSMARCLGPKVARCQSAPAAACTPPSFAMRPIRPQAGESRPVMRTLETSVQILKITKRTQFEIYVKTYQYGCCDKMSAF